MYRCCCRRCLALLFLPFVFFVCSAVLAGGFRLPQRFSSGCEGSLCFLYSSFLFFILFFSVVERSLECVLVYQCLEPDWIDWEASDVCGVQTLAKQCLLCPHCRHGSWQAIQHICEPRSLIKQSIASQPSCNMRLCFLIGRKMPRYYLLSLASCGVIGSASAQVNVSFP